MDITHVQKCERCEKLIDGNYGSGRFCNISCARAWSAVQNIEEARIKRSLSQKGKKGKPLDRLLQDKMQAGRVKSRLRKNVVVGDKWKIVYDILDITYGELEEYRKQHNVCEICKKPESITHHTTKNTRKLAIDHDHMAKKFRGLLCTKCNMSLDWYIANSENIQQYALKLHYDTSAT